MDMQTCDYYEQNVLVQLKEKFNKEYEKLYQEKKRLKKL